MTDDEDPKPLKGSGETPDELVRALRALGRDDRDAARLARVAERLGAAVGASGAALNGSRWLTGTKAGLTSIVLGLGALGVLGYALIGSRPASPIARRATAAPPAVIAIDAPAKVEPVVPRAAVVADDAPAPAPSAPSSRATPRLSAQKSSRASESARRSAAEVTELAPSSTLEPRPASADERPQAQPELRPEPKPAAEDMKPTAQLPAPQPARPSEAALLHDARKLASGEPEAALRLLDEHAKWFPSGTLVPEREVLRIEVLRRLGRDAEAERRLKQFEARYPQSIHLRRLERASGTSAEPD